MLTVLIATHNGSDTIERTLARLSELTSPQGGWKLVIVNNGSTDSTEDIISRWRDRLPLEYVVEPRLGKNNALNTGMTKVSGDLLIMSDDDVLPNRDWLIQWRQAVDRNPDCDVFGGAIEPYYESTPPAWLLRTAWITMLFAATDPNRSEGPMPAGGIFGPNMAIRATVVAKGARFNEGLGVGLTGLLGDETEFVKRLEKMGHRACFVPTARVRHIVQAHQLRWRWMLRRFYRHGRTQYVFDQMDANFVPPRELLRVPRYLIGRLATRTLTLPFFLLSFSPEVVLSRLRLIAYDLGMLAQARIGRPVGPSAPHGGPRSPA